MAHSVLHAEGTENRSKEAKEVEAESTAYIVCKHFGIDTSDYSFAYVAGWSSGKDTKVLKESMGAISKTAQSFISAIHAKLAEKDKEEVKETELSM